MAEVPVAVEAEEILPKCSYCGSEMVRRGEYALVCSSGRPACPVRTACTTETYAAFRDYDTLNPMYGAGWHAATNPSANPRVGFEPKSK